MKKIKKILNLLSEKRLLLCLIAVFAVMASSYALSANKYVLRVNGKATTFYADQFNEQDFISLKQFSKLVFPKSKYLADRGEIHYDNSIIKCTPASFFVVYDNNNDMNITQMALPAIKLKEETYVPLKPFFNALDLLKVFKVTVKGLEITIESDDYIPEKKTVKTKEKKKTEKIAKKTKAKTKKKNVLKKLEKQEEEPAEAENLKKKKIKTTEEAFIEDDNDSKETAGNEIKEKISLPKLLKQEQVTEQSPIITESFISASNIFSKGFKNIELLSGAPAPEQQPESIENPTPKDNKIENRIYPPNLYVLPTNLIRNELFKK